MEPNLSIGDIVVAKKVSEDKIDVDDIICFRQGQTVITHRISEIIQTDKGLEYKTKGDNNNAEDSGTITAKLIEGKVIKKLPYIGNLSIALQNKILLVIIIIIFYIYLAKANKRKRKQDERMLKRLKYERKNHTK